MRRIISAVAVLVVLAGCGGGGGNKGGNEQPPPDTFSITDDLNGVAYTYRLNTIAIACIYEPTSQLVICVLDSATTVPLAFFGPVVGERGVDVRLAALDLDEDGDILEEIALPVRSGSSLQFSEDAETLAINVTITLDPTDPVDLVGTATLVSTGNASARLKSATEWASRVGG